MSWNGPSANLTHRWPMDDANVSGTTISDVVGTLHGTAGSSVSSGTGPYTQARAIANDANGYITLPSSPLSDVTAAWTIGYWVFLPTINVTTFDVGAPRSCQFDDSTHQMDVGHDLITGGDVAAAGSAASFDDELTNPLMADSTWAHVTITHASGAAHPKIYLNAVAATLGGNPSGLGFTTGNALGARGAGNRPLCGSLYQFCVYSAELSAANVTLLYNAEVGGPVLTPTTLLLAGVG